jgi:hypothetical protein
MSSEEVKLFRQALDLLNKYHEALDVLKEYRDELQKIDVSLLDPVRLQELSEKYAKVMKEGRKE